MFNKLENDEQYSGTVVLAPFQMEKTYASGAKFNELNPEDIISLQTRPYNYYSDFGSEIYLKKDISIITLIEVAMTLKGVSDTIWRDGKKLYIDDEEAHNRIDPNWIRYEKNSITYLEASVRSETRKNEDDRLDRIYPYMVSGKPVFKFGNSRGGVPLPEFYEDYPFFVSSDKYYKLDDDKEDFYEIIYKTCNTLEPGERITPLDIFPSFCENSLDFEADIVKINYYTMDSGLGIGNIKCDCDYKGTFKLDKDFTFDPIDGKINFKDDCCYNSLSEFDEVLFEIYVEKYRKVSTKNGLSEEEVAKIATMQGIQSALLDYMYQSQVAADVTQKIATLAYTTLITVASTASIMIGQKIASKLLANTVQKAVVEAGANEITKEVVEQALKESIKKATMTMTALNFMGKLAYSCAAESLQEIYMDPIIEAFVTTSLINAGWDPRMATIGSIFAETGRETFMGAFTGQLLKGGSDTNIKTQIDIHYQQQITQEQVIGQAQEVKQSLEAEQSAPTFAKSLGKFAFTALGLLSIITAGGWGSSLFGPAFGTSFSVIGTYLASGMDGTKKLLKKHFGKAVGRYTINADVKAPIPEQRVYDTPSGSIGVLGQFIDNYDLSDGQENNYIEKSASMFTDLVKSNMVTFSLDQINNILLGAIPTPAIAVMAVQGASAKVKIEWKVNSLDQDRGKQSQQSIKERVKTFLSSVKAKASQISTKVKALGASIFSLSFLQSIGTASAYTGTASITTLSLALPVVGIIAGSLSLASIIKGRIDRRSNSNKKIYTITNIGSGNINEISSRVLIEEIQKIDSNINNDFINKFVRQYSSQELNEDYKISLILKLMFNIKGLSIDEQSKHDAIAICGEFLTMIHTYKAGASSIHRQPIIEKKNIKYESLIKILADFAIIGTKFSDLSRILKLSESEGILDISSEQYFMLRWLTAKNTGNNPIEAKKLLKKLDNYYDNFMFDRDPRDVRRNADMKKLTHIIRYGLLLEQVGFDARTLQPLQDHWHLGVICKYLSPEINAKILADDFDIHHTDENTLNILLEKLSLISYAIHHNDEILPRSIINEQAFKEVRDEIQNNRRVIKDLIAIEGNRDITENDISDKDFKEQFRESPEDLGELLKRINYLRRHGDEAFLRRYFAEYYEQMIAMGNSRFIGSHYLA